MNDVTFAEDAGGRTTAQGDFIGENARHAQTLGRGVTQRVGGGERNKAQELERNGKRWLAGMCPRLGIPESVQIQACTLYMMAGDHNFSAGRRTDEVIAACLYAACRRNPQNTIMLIDISELLRMNVFRLGEVYKDLCRELYIKAGGVGTQQLVEVESLIMKYCRKLQFADATRQVAEDAVKIVRRMKRDWMVTGRHPAGLCGACIILAARMNNFRRSIREVVWVAKVADITIMKRVEEFRRTKSAALTVDQFREYAPRMKHQHDPPILYESQLKKQKLEEKKRKRKEASLARETIEISDDNDSDSGRDTSTATPAADQTNGGKEPPRKRRRTDTAETASSAATQQEPRRDADGFVIPALPADPAVPGEEQPEKPKRGRKKKEPPPPVVITEEELADERDLEKEIEYVLNDDEIIDSRNEIEKAKDEERAKMLAEQQKKVAADNAKARRESEGITWLDGQTAASNEEAAEDDLEAEFANDPEVQNCLLSEIEQKAKEQIWVFNNEDWLRQQQHKQLVEDFAKNTGRNEKGKKGGKGAKRRKRHRIGDGSIIANATTPIETPAEASHAMVQKLAGNKFTTALSLDKLKQLYQRSPSSTSGSQPESTTPSNGAVSRDRTPSTGGREAAQNSDSSVSPTPAPRAEATGAQSPPATQQGAAAPAFPMRRTAATQPAPATAEQTQAQATEEAGDDESEGDEGDYIRDEADYGSDLDTPTGFGCDDDREDIGEDDYERAIDPTGGWSVNDDTFGEDY